MFCQVFWLQLLIFDCVHESELVWFAGIFHCRWIKDLVPLLSRILTLVSRVWLAVWVHLVALDHCIVCLLNVWLLLLEISLSELLAAQIVIEVREALV